MATFYNLTVFILRNRDFSLEAAANRLRVAPSLTGVRVKPTGSQLLRLDFDEWILNIALEDSPWVEEECRETIEHHQYPDPCLVADLAQCKARLRIWSEDQDIEMDHSNDWLLTVECLTGHFDGLFPFDPVSGEWWFEEGTK